jgi:hypothetical protein
MVPFSLSGSRLILHEVALSIPALMSARISFALMVFFPIGSPLVERLRGHDIMGDCRGASKSHKSTLKLKKAQRILQLVPLFSTATLHSFRPTFPSLAPAEWS